MGGRRSKSIALKKGLYVIGEGITEQYYFTHLKSIKNYRCVVKPRFFGKTDIARISKQVQKLLMGDITVICIFDADVSQRNKVEEIKFQQFKKKYAKNKNVIICDSLPSIEFWFLLHFVQTNKSYNNSKSVEKELLKFISSYDKTKGFLENSKWVEKLVENLDDALTYAQNMDIVEGVSYSNIYKAILKLEETL